LETHGLQYACADGAECLKLRPTKCVGLLNNTELTKLLNFTLFNGLTTAKGQLQASTADDEAQIKRHKPELTDTKHEPTNSNVTDNTVIKGYDGNSSLTSLRTNLMQAVAN
jgi:hypothetical protein